MFENPGFPGSHWIKIRLVGVDSNRFGVGCRIRALITEDETQRSVFDHVSSGGSFGANPLSTRHIGLGSAKKIDSLEIFWPVSGMTQVFENVAAGQEITITEGDSRWR